MYEETIQTPRHDYLVDVQCSYDLKLRVRVWKKTTRGPVFLVELRENHFTIVGRKIRKKGGGEVVLDVPPIYMNRIVTAIHSWFSGYRRVYKQIHGRTLPSW